MQAINSFWRTQLATSIVCGKEIADQFEKVDHLLARVRIKAVQGDVSGAWQLFDEIQHGKRELGVIICVKLNFDTELLESTKPQ